MNEDLAKVEINEKTVLFGRNSTDRSFSSKIILNSKYGEILLKRTKEQLEKSKIHLLAEWETLGFSTNDNIYLSQEIGKDSINFIIKHGCASASVSRFAQNYFFNSFNTHEDKYRKELEEIKTLIYKEVKDEVSRYLIQKGSHNRNYRKNFQFQFDKFSFFLKIDSFISIYLNIFQFYDTYSSSFIIPLDYFYLMAGLCRLIPEMGFSMKKEIDVDPKEFIKIEINQNKQD